jgi:hypothetical protein
VVCWNQWRQPIGQFAGVGGYAALLLVTLIVGLTTAEDYGATIDEFNANDYGPKALAWYTSGFTDRSQFETVEFSLWYYGPWFQMITAAVQSLGLAEPLAVRHALTFVVGLLGIATVCPIGHLSFGPWVGLSALTLCLFPGTSTATYFSRRSISHFLRPCAGHFLPSW